MNTIINFTYSEGRGKTTIVLDKFFPTSQDCLRKLLKMVDEDYEHRSELRETIVQHIGLRASELLDGEKDTKKIDEEIQKLTAYTKTKAGKRYLGQLDELKAKKREAVALLRNLKTLAEHGGRKP